MLVDDLQVRIVNAATGELLRDLTIDPSREGFEPPTARSVVWGGRKPSVVLLRQRRLGRVHR
jgi:hypothetical protein